MATALCQRATVTAVVLRRFAGWDELSFLSFYSDSTAGYCGGAGVHRTTGGGAVLFSSPGRFRLGCAGGSWSVVPATAGARRFPCRFTRLCAGTGGRGLLGYLHFKWATRRSGTWPCDGGNWFADCSVNFRANWSASGW